MAEVLPQVRGRADTQSREVGSKLETPTVLPLRDTTNNTSSGRMITSESVEGEIPRMTAATVLAPWRRRYLQSRYWLTW